MTGKWVCDVCKKRAFETLEEATAHEAGCKVHPFFQPKRTKNAVSKQQPQQQPLKKPMAKKPKPTSSTTTHPFFEKASKKKKVSLEAINIESVDPATVLDQQRALDFFSSSKRHEQPDKGTKTTKTTKLGGKSHKAKLATRFPVPNHVIPSSFQLLKEDEALSLPPKRATMQAITNPDSQEDDNKPVLPSTRWWKRDTTSDTVISIEPDVLLNQAIANAIKTTTACTKTAKGERPLLVDRYYYNNDDSEERDHSVQQLEQFIERFKIERLQAQTRRKKRHDRMQGIEIHKKKTTKKKKRKIHDDDDLWEDEDDDDDTKLISNICLLTGPSGCGKSSLVYNVAKRMECQSVLELHPGEVRSGAQVRKFMQEATKSLSTRDMLLSSREINHAAMVFAKQQPLVDSDDDESSSNNMKKGVAVTIILLDEVDTLFETDVGFWPAVVELAKTSKSPIILTANTIPNGLLQKSLPYTHICMKRPTITECAARLTIIAEYEGFKVHGNLEHVAILGDCDMRRILNAIHLYAMAPSEQGDIDTKCCGTTMLTSIEDSAPIVESVEPSTILADEITCLEIHGKNFQSLIVQNKPSPAVEVMIGDQVCPFAHVLDDTTILAVCQPRQLPSYVDCQGYYRGTRRRSLAVAHPAVTVRARLSRAGVSNSSATIVVSSLNEDVRILAKPRQVFLDVQFHGFTTKDDLDSDDDDENELGSNSTTPDSGVCLGASPSDDPELVKKCLSLFEKALKEREVVADPPQSPVVVAREASNAAEVGLLDDISFDCQLVSDAAFLQDVGLESTPFLAGPCQGFGFTMTDEYPRRTNENSKPPGFQRTLAENWNDDCFFFGAPNSYMQLASRKHIDYKYLIRMEHSARGSLGCSTCTDFAEEDEIHEHTLGEEDMFLHRQAPNSVLSLPFLLLKSLRTWKGSSWLDWSICERKRDSVRSQSMHFLSSLVYSGDAKTRLQFGVLDRRSDVFSKTFEHRQQDYFLDKLSMIRCNLISDIASTNAEPSSERSGRRTRQSRRRNISFMERMVPFLVRRDDPEDVQECTSHLIATTLHRCPSHVSGYV